MPDDPELVRNYQTLKLGLSIFAPGADKEVARQAYTAERFLQIVSEERPQILQDLYGLFRAVRPGGSEQAELEVIEERIRIWQQGHHLESELLFQRARATVISWNFLWRMTDKEPGCKWYFEQHEEYLPLLGMQTEPDPTFGFVVRVDPFQPAGWNPGKESLPDAKKRIESEFRRYLKGYLARCSEFAVFLPKHRPADIEPVEERLRLLVARQLHGWSYRYIAKKLFPEQQKGQDLHARAERDIKRAAELLGLKIRMEQEG